MFFIGQLLIWALSIYSFIIILEVIINWLIIFDVINVKNDKAQNLMRLLSRMTDPVYSRLRKYVPPIGGIDITPIIVLFGIYLLQMLIAQLFYGFAYGPY
jgi:YggT family protein